MSRRLLKPVLETEDGVRRPLPVRCEPEWTPEMGRRLMKARLWTCPRIDRRGRRLWAHKEFCQFDGPCTCLSQSDLAQQLAVSQSVISRIEQGKPTEKNVSIESLYSVFGEVADYILLGVNAQKYEGNAVKRGKRNS